MKFHSKVAYYEKVPSAIRQFVSPGAKVMEEHAMPRVKIVLVNGVEFILESQGQLPRWSFTTKTPRQFNQQVAGCLSVSYSVDDNFIRRDKDGIHYDVNEQSLQSVELFGSPDDQRAFSDTMYENC